MLSAEELKRKALESYDKSIEADKVRLFNKLQQEIDLAVAEDKNSCVLSFKVNKYKQVLIHEYWNYRKESVDFVVETMGTLGYKVRRTGWFKTTGLEVSW